MDAGTDAGSDGGSTDAGFHASTDAGGGADAGCATTDGLGPLVDGLFHTSESDRPVTIGSAMGGGTAVASADVAALRALVGASAAELSSIAATGRFFDRLVVDPTREPPVPESRPADLRAAFEAITEPDRVDFEVFEEDGVTVRVYVIGRTACGDAIWLASVAIRT